ncbi:MAG: hypothetical protein KC620_08000 [Myxococcales bacterium]|nr:hypothetical protein [Myxococcales bacterium]
MNTSAALARKGGFELTADMLDAFVGVVRCVTRAPLAPDEHAELRAQLVAQFDASPLPTLVQVLKLGQLLNLAASSADPLAASQTRDSLHALLYLQYRGSDTACIRIIDRHVEVVCFDAAAGTVLTRGDVHGLMGLAGHWGAARGAALARTAERDAAFFRRVTTAFTVGSPVEQRFLASAELLDAHWSALADNARGEALAMLGGTLRTAIEQVYAERPNDPEPSTALLLKAKKASLEQMQHTSQMMAFSQEMHRSWMSSFFPT